MKDSFFVVFTILIIAGLIYFLYKVILGVAGDNRNDKDEVLQVTAAEILEQLNNLYRQKKYNIVESSARKYLEKRPNDLGVRTILAKSMYASGRVYEAVDQVKALIKAQPNNVDSKFLLASCYQKAENYLKAISVYQEILEDYPDNTTAIKELAKTFYESNQKRSALKMYQQLQDYLENNADKVQNMETIAKIHVEYREYQDAIKLYESILDLYPENISTLIALIDLYTTTNNYDPVIELSLQIINLYQNEEQGLWAMNRLMKVYNAIHEYDKALELAEKINLHPLSNKVEVAENIAQILLEKDQVDDSIEILKALVLQDQNNIGLKKSLAHAYICKSDFNSALYTYKQILDIATPREIKKAHSEMSNLYASWATYLFAQNDLDGCFKNFTIAMQYDNQNALTYFKIGAINKEIKNYNEAISQFKKSIVIEPENPEYYLELASCYEEIGSIYEQKKALSDSLKYGNENPEVYYKLGVIYFTQNDMNSAISNMENALKLNPDYIEAKHKLALIYEHLGNTEDAVKLYEEILDVEPDNEEIIANLKMINS